MFRPLAYVRTLSLLDAHRHCFRLYSVNLRVSKCSRSGPQSHGCRSSPGPLGLTAQSAGAFRLCIPACPSSHTIFCQFRNLVVIGYFQYLFLEARHGAFHYVTERSRGPISCYCLQMMKLCWHLCRVCHTRMNRNESRRDSSLSRLAVK